MDPVTGISGKTVPGYKGLKAVNLDFVSEASEEITVRYTGGPWKLHNATEAFREGYILLPLRKQALLKGILLRGLEKIYLAQRRV